MSGKSQYDLGLDKNAANYVPLTPLSFLERSAAVYPNHVSAVYEGRNFTWAQTLERCRRFASYLAKQGIGDGDTVAAMLPNVPAMNELHFSVAMAGAVLNALNIRLDAPSIAFQLDHGAAKIILVDPEFVGVIADAMKQMSGPKPAVIDVDDASFAGGKRIGSIEYEAAVAQGDPDFVGKRPADEWDAIALSYTSGTTGNPKGVVTHHRGAYLNAVSNILAGNLYNFGNDYIIEGKFDRILLRPISSLFQILFETFRLEAMQGIITGAFCMWWASRQLHVAWPAGKVALLIFFEACASVIYVAVFLMLTCVSFWFEDRVGVHPPVWNVINFGRFPLSIYNGAVQFVLCWIIPFGLASFYPSVRMLGRAVVPEYAPLVPLVAAVFLALAISLWNFGTRHYSSTGS